MERVINSRQHLLHAAFSNQQNAMLSMDACLAGPSLRPGAQRTLASSAAPPLIRHGKYRILQVSVTP
jgi:hypothetical protein